MYTHLPYWKCVEVYNLKILTNVYAMNFTALKVFSCLPKSKKKNIEKIIINNYVYYHYRIEPEIVCIRIFIINVYTVTRVKYIYKFR